MAPPDAYARPRGAALPPREGRRGPPSPSRLGCPTAIRGGERTFQHPSAHLGRGVAAVAASSRSKGENGQKLEDKAPKSHPLPQEAKPPLCAVPGALSTRRGVEDVRSLDRETNALLPVDVRSDF